MSEATTLPKPSHDPAAPIKARDGLTPTAVAKLFQARIKTLADVKRLSDAELKKLPLGIGEYLAVKKFADSLSFGPESDEASTSTAC